MTTLTTLDEAIKHYEELAEKQEKEYLSHAHNEEFLRRISHGVEAQIEMYSKNECKRCAEEHRQLAEWLRELKELRKNKIGIYGRADAIGVGCANCIYLKTEDYTKRPCGICCYNYSSKFEEVNTDERDSN